MPWIWPCSAMGMMLEEATDDRRARRRRSSRSATASFTPPTCIDDQMTMSDPFKGSSTEEHTIPPQPRDVPRYDMVRWQGRRSSACVVIPVINEGKRIRRLLARMAAIAIPLQADVIIVDGESSDFSLDTDYLNQIGVAGLLVKRETGKLSAQLRCAYDFVVRQGYEEIITIDGNDKDDPDAIPAFIAALRDGNDFVQASRFLPGGTEENTPWKRRLAVRLIHAPTLSLASGFHWTDTTQGFRGYSLRMLIDPRLAIFRDVFMDYELLAYINYRAPRLGFKCIEMPTARRYPTGEKIPTKISLRGEMKLFAVLIAACVGRYDPC